MKCTKIYNARAQLLFCSLNLLFWWRSRCRRRLGLPKLPNIGKTTTTNQCKRVPDLWRPGSVKIKRYYVINIRLILKAKRGKEIQLQ